MYKIKYTVNMLTKFSEHWKRDPDTGELKNFNAGQCILDTVLEAEQQNQ